MSVMVTTDFPKTHIESAWNWLQEYPLANFDDYGPTTLEQFRAEFDSRIQSGETIFGVKKDGKYEGFIAYKPLSPDVGTFHGICFSQGFFTPEEKRDAVKLAMSHLFERGTRKICASYFANNSKIAALLADLGFIHEGTLRAQTRQHGALLDMEMVAKFEEAI